MASYGLTVAFCLLSPPGSNLYQSGPRAVLAEDYVLLLMNGLNAAKARGRRIVCMGNVDIRTGSMCEDATGPAHGIVLGPDTQPALGEAFTANDWCSY